MTIGDCLHPAMEIQDEQDAMQYLKAYAAHIQAFLDKEPRTDGKTAYDVARINLGYFAGYYDQETRERVERLFNCQHPIFGNASAGVPTTQEAFEAGKVLAISSRK